MMNKKIYVPLIVVAVAVSAGMFGFEQMNSNYDPFSDPKYADSYSDQPDTHQLYTYDEDKKVVRASGLFEALTFNQVVNQSDLIISGSIKDIEYVEEATNPEEPDAITVSTIYTVTIHSYMKGSDNDHQIKYIILGGETKNHITIFEDMFVFEKRNQVILFLEKFSTIDGETIYAPLSDIGVYRVTNGGPNSGEVHKFGEDTTVPLPEFKSMIKEIIG